MPFPIFSRSLSGSGRRLSYRTLQLISVFTGSYPVKHREAIDTFIETLVSEGLWGKMQSLWILAAGGQGDAQIGWNHTYFFNTYGRFANTTPPTTLTFERYRGLTTLSPINTLQRFTPGAYPLRPTNGTMGLWSLTPDALPGVDFGCVVPGGQLPDMAAEMSVCSESNQFVTRLHATVPFSVPSPTGRGWFSVSRTALDLSTVYIGGNPIAVNTQPEEMRGISYGQGGQPDGRLLTLGGSGVGDTFAPATVISPIVRQYAAVVVAEAWSDAEHQRFYSLLKTYLSTFIPLNILE